MQLKSVCTDDDLQQNVVGRPMFHPAAIRDRRRAYIQANFRPGATGAEIERATGVPRLTIIRDLRAMGWPVGKRGRKLSPRDSEAYTRRCAEILAAVQAEPTRTLQSFGDQFGLTRERIRQIVRDAGWGAKPHAKRAPSPARLAREARKAERMQRLAQVVALRKRGYKQVHIAEQLGTSQAAISRYLLQALRYGITVQP